MNKVLWTFHILLTLTFALFGMQKVVMPIADLIAMGMLWIEDFPAWQVRTIGALEVLGVVGLNAPYLLKSLPKILVPLAAGGLGITMVGAVVTHLVRADPLLSIVITSALVMMSAVLAGTRLQQLRTTAAPPATEAR